MANNKKIDYAKVLASYPEDVRDKFLGQHPRILEQLSEEGDVSDVNYVRERIDNLLAFNKIVQEVVWDLDDVYSDEELDAVIAKVKSLPSNIDIFSQPVYQKAVKKCFVSNLSSYGNRTNNFKIVRKIQNELGKDIDFTESIEEAIVKAANDRSVGYSGAIKSEFKELPLNLKENKELKEVLFSYFKDGFVSLAKNFERELGVHFDYSKIEGYEDATKKAFINSLAEGRIFDAVTYAKSMPENTDIKTIEGYQKAVMSALMSILNQRDSYRLAEEVSDLRNNFGKGTEIEYEDGLINAIKKTYLSAGFSDIKEQIRKAFPDLTDFDALDTKRKAA